MVQIKSKNGGFSLIELVVSVFLIAVVLGGVLLLLAANLSVVDKANELMTAKTMLQFSEADIKNIEFPPVYNDRQSAFGCRPLSGTAEYKGPDEIDALYDGMNWIEGAALPGGVPEQIRRDYILRRYNFRYGYDEGIYTLFDDATIGDTDFTMLHRVDTYVLKRNGDLLLKHTTLISRDGMF